MAVDWLMHVDGQQGQAVAPIPYGGTQDHFWPHLMKEE